MRNSADRQSAQARRRQEPCRVERRFTPGRPANDMVKDLVRAHST